MDSATFVIEGTCIRTGVTAKGGRWAAFLVGTTQTMLTPPDNANVGQGARYRISGLMAWGGRGIELVPLKFEALK